MAELAISRVAWVAAAAAWAVSGLVSVTQPSYWDPVTMLDWAAVWSYSAALLLLAPAILLIARLTPGRPITAAAIAVAGGVVAAGGANALEDGFGVKAFGNAYVAGILVGWLSIVWLGLAQQRYGFPRLALLSGMLFLGLALASVGGGLVVAASLASVALAPAWFLRAARPGGPDPIPDPDPEVGPP